MKISLLMMISIVGILLLCLSYSEAQTNIVSNPFYLVHPTDPAPSNIHNNCDGNIIFLEVCLTWTDPFDPNYPNAVKLRHPYARYTLVVTSSLGGSLTLPNLIQSEITLNQNSAANLIGPGATVTFKVAGQQIDNAAALSQFSQYPLVLIFPTSNGTLTPPTQNPNTTNGIKKLQTRFDTNTSSIVASWTLGTRPVANVILNAYCDRTDRNITNKVNAHGNVRSSTATTLSVPFKYKGTYDCKIVVTTVYSNGANEKFVHRDLKFSS